MTIKRIRNYAGMARQLSEAYGNSVGFYLKPMMKKVKAKLQAEKEMMKTLQAANAI